MMDSNSLPPGPPPGMGYGSGRLGLTPDAEVIETVGSLIEFWGFKRALGRVWALLYLSPYPLSAQDVSDQLGMSAGAVSMTLNELQVWGVISRAHRPGDRKEYFSAEEDILKMVTRVISDRELRQVENACDVFARAEISLTEKSNEAHASTRKHAPDEVDIHDFQRSRVAHLRKISAAGKALLQGFILTSKLDASPLRKLNPFRRRGTR
jgi:HTH-type transcriptional regulator, glycine betaine synthesis regulator